MAQLMSGTAFSCPMQLPTRANASGTSQCRPFTIGPARYRQRCFGRMKIRAEKTPEQKGTPPADPKKKEELVQGLKKGGIDQATANKILQVWQETGAESPDQLRKMLLKRSASIAAGVVLQTLLDAGASYGGFSTGASIAQSNDFFGKIIIQYGASFLGVYFLIGVLFDIFTLGAITFSTVQYSTNTESFMAAVRELAGPQQSGINVVNKVAQAVNTGKVLLALNSISSILRSQTGQDSESTDSLKYLTSFLTLQKAEQKGFSREKYNLSSDEAGDIATVFSRYDTNDDMVLEQREVNDLFFQEGYDLDPPEVTRAIELLDKNNDGLISFDEFVDWWVNQVSEEAKSKVNAGKQ